MDTQYQYPCASAQAKAPYQRYPIDTSAKAGLATVVNSTDRLQFREALRWSPGWWEDRSRAYRGGWCKRPTIGLATTIRTSIASARLWRYADNGCGHRFSCHCRLRRWSVSGLAGSPSSSGAKGTPNNLLFHEL